MSDVTARLSTALADRYRIERELGQGGMALVYLAEDLKLHRQVAIKVLRPELAVSLGADRFLKEIEVTANLQHPNILQLYEADEADEFLYYVMPYIEGETLRDRLTRERKLSLDDALKLTEDVAEALGYAHERGIVHRDIKPENILLTSGRAVVADFGIARAVEVAGGDRLTGTGLAVGTPAYMSPEQAMGLEDVDARSDVYSLGCVLYEMVSGHGPFAGQTPRSVIAKHAADTVPDLRTSDPSIPVYVKRAVEKALAKVPSERFQSVSELVDVLTSGTVVRAVQRPPRRKVIAYTVVAALAVVGAYTVIARVGQPKPAPLDANAVAVVPFRIAGGAELKALREGIVDLMHGKLTGGIGPRAVDPGTMMRAWRRVVSDEATDLSLEESVALAQRVGAGQVLVGSMVQTGAEVTVNATLYRVPTTLEIARASVGNVVDSLALTIDRVVGQLLSLQAGELATGAASLSPSLDAVTAYLEGKKTLRRGRAIESLTHFKRALAIDSTFALAAVWWAVAAAEAGNTNTDDFVAARNRAWSLHTELSERDQAWVTAMWGRPNVGWTSTNDRMVAAERAVELAPDDPMTRGILGELLFAHGRNNDDSVQIRRAVLNFDRALELDSTNLEALSRRMFAAIRLSDTVTVRRLREPFLALSARGETAGYDRWMVARALGDSAALARVRAELGASYNDFNQVGYRTAEEGLPYDDWVAALERFEAGAVTGRDRQQAMLQRIRIASLQGRSSESRAYADSLVAAGSPFVGAIYMGAVVRAMLGEGSDSVAAVKVDELQRLLEEGRPGVSPYGVACAQNIWMVHTGDTTSARALVEGAAPLIDRGLIAPFCPYLVETMLAVGDPTSLEYMAERLDSLLRVDVTILNTASVLGNVVLARVRELQGDRPAALEAIRRERTKSAFTMPYLLREEGRLAALTGDRVRAIEAYRHYLALRTNPEPVLQPEVDEVRRALAILVGEGGIS